MPLGVGGSPRGPRAALRRLRGVYSPTHYYVRVSRAASFTGIRLLHRHRAFSKTQRLHSGVEPPEMLNVPWVLDGYSLRSLQARGARPGNMNNLEWALPHGRELVQPLPGENPSEHEIPYLKGPGADVAAVVSS